MSKTKFTKGEWEIVSSKSFDDDMEEIGETTHLVIGNRITTMTHNGIVGAPADYDEQIANASLIAAAPKLYAMIETLINRGAELLAIDEIDNEEDAATIHANFNDSVLLSVKLLAEARGE